MKRISVIIILALVVLGTMWFIYDNSQEKPIEYNTKTPIITDISKKTIATGTVEPRKEIEIKPQGVSGIIDKLYVEAGVYLKKGDPIARIKIIPNMLSLNNAISRLKRANLQFDNTVLTFKRDKSLFEKLVISEVEFQKSELSFRNSEEELESAQDNLQLIKEGVSKRSKTATNTIIRSTIDGLLLDVPVKEGFSVTESNTFNSGTTVAIVADMGEMIFKGKLDETEVGKIKKGMNLELTIGAIDDIKFNALLEFISPKGKVENGAVRFEIKASVELNEDFFIRSGYSANAEIVLQEKKNILAINEGLLEFKNDSTFVYIQQEEGVFKRTAVKTGISDGINIEILEGLTIDKVLRAGKKTASDKLKAMDKKS